MVLFDFVSQNKFGMLNLKNERENMILLSITQLSVKLVSWSCWRIHFVPMKTKVPIKYFTVDYTYSGSDRLYKLFKKKLFPHYTNGIFCQLQ